MLKQKLNTLYLKLNKKSLVHPDPLEFLYRYPNLSDREIVGLIAATLAYGRVNQILKSVDGVLEKMTPSPFKFVTENKGIDALEKIFSGFVHRFQRASHIASLIYRMGKLIEKKGSLQMAFLSHYQDTHETIMPALQGFVADLTAFSGPKLGHLVPLPAKKSACKRLHLFLRWMVRSDAVDPGGWDGIDPAKLIIPLDVHMHRIGKGLGLTARNQSDLVTAIEITRGFSQFSPHDPTCYDFALTRLGIRADLDFEDQLHQMIH